MSTVNLPYVDRALDYTVDGGHIPFWRHLHWGLFEDPAREDDSPERYYAAAEALTDHILQAGQVADGTQVLDVGCGFGGALDYVRTHRRGCRLAGVNIDERQVQEARRLLGGPEDIAFTVADGCRLPVADRSVDHVLAVECLFHFPSRKKFFREAARVLRPGGTLALSDFLFNRGTLSSITPDLFVTDDQAAWYGHQSRPLTSDGYGRLGRGTGFDVLVDDDVTEGTFPTYAALRRLYRERELPDGVRAIDGLANLASAGVLGYHVLAFRRRG